MTATRIPSPPARVHFIGIGGIGMSGLARILQSRGYHVSGSDSSENDQTRSLAAGGIAVQHGHAETVSSSQADLVVVTSAVQPGNPEIDAAGHAGVPIIKRAELLGMLSREKQTIAVAGSHGKSTTSGMLVTALQYLDTSPSFAIGAVITSTGTNAHWDQGRWFVVEADEYDWSFLTLEPSVGIITNIEFDHPDLFTQESYERAFLTFAQKVTGTLILGGDDPGVRRLLCESGHQLNANIVTFGERADLHWRLAPAASDWQLTGPAGRSYQVRLQVPGKHNALNATAAIAALTAAGFAPANVVDAVATFEGVGRRFELLGEGGGITVIDDYAHHPTEIRAVIAAARNRYPGQRVWAIFQPHTYTRTIALLEEFAGALRLADRVLLLEIYAARELDKGLVTSSDLQNLIGAKARLAGGLQDVVPAVIEELKPGDVVILLGAGDITTIGPALMAALDDRAPA